MLKIKILEKFDGLPPYQRKTIFEKDNEKNLIQIFSFSTDYDYMNNKIVFCLTAFFNYVK